MLPPNVYDQLQDGLNEIVVQLRNLGVVANELSERNVRRDRVKKSLVAAMGAVDEVRHKVFLHQKQDRRMRGD